MGLIHRGGVVHKFQYGAVLFGHLCVFLGFLRSFLAFGLVNTPDVPMTFTHPEMNILQFRQFSLHSIVVG